MKTNKAAGMGGLSNEILFKSAPEKLPNLVLMVYNLTLNYESTGLLGSDKALERGGGGGGVLHPLPVKFHPDILES